MSIHYLEVIPKGFPSDFYAVMERFDESATDENRHQKFTEKELKQLLDLCRLAERDADHRFGVMGFSFKSDDRTAIEAMLAEKQKQYPKFSYEPKIIR